MRHYYIYWALDAIVLLYALIRGGAPEKGVASIWVASNLLSLAAISLHPFGQRYWSIEPGEFAVDVLTVIALGAIAFRANRRWPIVVAGLQLLSVAAHISKAIAPDMIRIVYVILISYVAYPVLLTIILGVHNHQRRLRRYRVDPSWRPRISV